MENVIIKRTAWYLISRDMFLLFLIVIRMLICYGTLNPGDPILIILLIATAIPFVFFCIRLITLALKAKQNQYVSDAFKDEYFRQIKLKSGYNAFLCMLIVSVAALVANGIMNLQPACIPFPATGICEIIIFSGVVTSDITKILMSRGQV